MIENSHLEINVFSFTTFLGMQRKNQKSGRDRLSFFFFYCCWCYSVILGNNNNKLLENSVLHTRNQDPLNQHIKVCKGIYDPQQVYETLTQQRQENKEEEEK